MRVWKFFLVGLLISSQALAGIAPPTSKGSGDSTNIPTTNYQFPSVPVTHTGMTASVAAAPSANPTLTGNVTISGATASTVAIFNASKQLISSAVTSATLAFLDIGSSLTALLALKAPLASPTFTGTTNFPGTSSIDGSGNAAFGGTSTALRYSSTSSSASLPSLAVSSGNGIYNNGTNIIGVAVNSTNVGGWTTTGFSTTGTFGVTGTSTTAAINASGAIAVTLPGAASTVPLVLTNNRNTTSDVLSVQMTSSTGQLATLKATNVSSSTGESKLDIFTTSSTGVLATQFTVGGSGVVVPGALGVTGLATLGTTSASYLSALAITNPSNNSSAGVQALFSNDANSAYIGRNSSANTSFGGGANSLNIGTASGSITLMPSNTVALTATSAGVIVPGTFGVTGTTQHTGVVGIGAAPNTDMGINIGGTPLTGGSGTQYGISVGMTATSSASSGVYGLSSQPTTAASTTVTNAFGINVGVNKGSGGTIGTAYGIQIDNINVGTTNYSINAGLGQVRLGFNSLGGAYTFLIDANNNIVPGSTALATTATNGFQYMKTTSGLPTGVPATTYTGQTPMVYDTTNHKICVYDPTTPSWRCSAAM